MNQVVGLLGKKIGMTSIFDEAGVCVPVTVVSIGENVVTRCKTKESDGYVAVQVGGFATKEAKLNKPERGQLKKAELPALKPLKEYRVPSVDTFKVGESLKIEEVIKEGMLVDVQGNSIGKGFQGTIKRYNAGRGPMSHGSKFHRSMGSIGAGTTPGRVFKGLHMPGQMGNEIVTVRHLKVMKIDSEKRYVLIRGAVPGVEGGTVVIRESIGKWNASAKK